MKVYLTKWERQALLLEMPQDKKEAIFLSIKNTYKTIFGNILARSKGSENWSFAGYIDHAVVQENVHCQCGQPLRYEFIVEHKETHEQKSLGITHLQEIIQMPKHIARSVYRGIHQINYDLDELLLKWKNGWQMPSYIVARMHLLNLQSRPDIQVLIDAELPLLERHVTYLTELGEISYLRNENLRMYDIDDEQLDNPEYEEAIELIASHKINAMEFIESKYEQLVRKLIEEKNGIPLVDSIDLLEALNMQSHPKNLQKGVIHVFMRYFILGAKVGKFTRKNSLVYNNKEILFSEVLDPEDKLIEKIAYGQNDYRFRYNKNPISVK